MAHASCVSFGKCDCSRQQTHNGLTMPGCGSLAHCESSTSFAVGRLEAFG